MVKTLETAARIHDSQLVYTEVSDRTPPPPQECYSEAVLWFFFIHWERFYKCKNKTEGNRVAKKKTLEGVMGSSLAGTLSEFAHTAS